MSRISIEKLDKLIADFSKKEDKPEKILIGYKAYAELMSYPKFADEINNSALSPDKRKYKKIKIKVTQDDYQLEII